MGQSLTGNRCTKCGVKLPNNVERPVPDGLCEPCFKQRLYRKAMNAKRTARSRLAIANALYSDGVPVDVRELS